MSDFHEGLLKLRSALLERALSLLPPNATPASSEASGEAAIIFEVLASIPRSAFGFDVEQPAKSKPVLGVRDGHLVVLGAGWIRVSTSDGNVSVIDVKATDIFGKVVDAAKKAVLAFAESNANKPGRMLGYREGYGLGALTSGRINIGVDEGPLAFVVVEKNEPLGSILGRIHGTLADLAELHHEPLSLFGMKEGRFTVLRAGKLVLGETWTEGAPISVATGDSLERVLDKLKEALVYRAGGTVVKDAPPPVATSPASEAPKAAPSPTSPILGIVDGHATVLRDGTLCLDKYGDGQIATISLPVSKADGFDAFATLLDQAFGNYAGKSPTPKLGKGVILRDSDRTVELIFGKGDPYRPHMPRDLAVLLAARSDANGTPAPEDVIPANSVGIIYPKIAVTETHDTAVVPAGALLLPGLPGSTSRRGKPSAQTIATTVARTGVALVCKTLDGSPWPSEVTIWSFDAPPPGCFAAASTAPPRT